MRRDGSIKNLGIVIGVFPNDVICIRFSIVAYAFLPTPPADSFVERLFERLIACLSLGGQTKARSSFGELHNFEPK